MVITKDVHFCSELVSTLESLRISEATLYRTPRSYRDGAANPSPSNDLDQKLVPGAANASLPSGFSSLRVRGEGPAKKDRAL